MMVNHTSRSSPNMNPETASWHRKSGPKRILALDGGGIRGAITLGYLERIERMLRDRYGKPDLVLCDYFDLIGGTSTGAVIAAALAIGMDAASVKEMYLKLGEEIFEPAVSSRIPARLRKIALAVPSFRWKVRGFDLDVTRRWFSSFNPAPLEARLTEVLGNRTLGDVSLRCGLCIVTKRADTGSLWVIHNNPDGKYYHQNRGMLLRDIVRASTAAPVYFPPEELHVGGGQTGAFVDGGVSLANNPALTLFLLATISGYRLEWPLGEDKLLIVSVGTGSWPRREDGEAVLNYRVWDWAAEVPSMFMSDATWHVQLLLQAMSNTPTRTRINREVGDLHDSLLTGEPLLSYIRYNVELDENVMNSLGLPDLAPKVRALREMSAAENRHHLAEIGERAAANDVASTHFRTAFDTQPCARVVALAGRRIDAMDANEARFPLDNVASVRARIAKALRQRPVAGLVCSAACGADLLALEVAQEMGIPCHIVLPLPVEQFRATSVADRAGDWAMTFDRVITHAQQHGNRITYANGDHVSSYLAANTTILDSAMTLANQKAVGLDAIVVWDGVSRGPDDVTYAFMEEARRRSSPIMEIDTKSP